MSPQRPLLVNANDLEQWPDRYDAAEAGVRLADPYGAVHGTIRSAQ